ncbi:hypothetical protein C8233_09050 [Halomonas sp. SF2003]|nr:hypothetical protein C8233_09050 [Halomonas sp. SF2003]
MAAVGDAMVAGSRASVRQVTGTKQVARQLRGCGRDKSQKINGLARAIGWHAQAVSRAGCALDARWRCVSKARGTSLAHADGAGRVGQARASLQCSDAFGSVALKAFGRKVAPDCGTNPAWVYGKSHARPKET